MADKRQQRNKNPGHPESASGGRGISQATHDSPPCCVTGCRFPGMVEFHGSLFCLRHLRDRLGVEVVLTTHLDVVAAPTCKSTTQTYSTLGVGR